MDIIVNADDFGLTKGVNEGIIDAHLNGIVTRTTLIMNGFAVEEAVHLANKYPSLKVGVHLTCTFGRPLNEKVAFELTNESGNFKFTSIESTLTTNEARQIKKEWETQIEAFKKTGLELDHIDSHHHVHGWLDLKDVILELGHQYNVPIRYVESLKEYPENLLTEYLWLDFYKDGVNKNLFEKLSELTYNSVEIMTHPAVVDEELKKISGYTSFREKETLLLKTMKLRNGMTLV